jgi:DNA-binding MarR family transcriptional regulator
MAGAPEVDYAKLLSFRVALRRFERWSQQEARAVDLTPAQHQLLLCVRGHPDPAGPTISDAADYLLLRHHSTVELVDRASKAGLVERQVDADDARVARVCLTSRGEEILAALTEAHLEELQQLGQFLQSVVAEASLTQFAALRR